MERDERARMGAKETSWALREVNRAATEADQQLARRIGLRPLDYAAISHILVTTQAIGPYELSTRLGISAGSASELVDRLERAGHVDRRRDATDRRRVGLHPTEHAVGQVQGELSPVITALDELEGDFTAAERTAIVRYLRAAAQILWDYASEEATETRPR